MCTRGVWQLEKVLLRYSRTGGSSAGARDFIRANLLAFARENPQLTVATDEQTKKHPVVFGTYRDGTTKEIDVKNRDAAYVAGVFQKLRDVSTGRVRDLGRPVITRRSSIQGAWDPSTTFDGFSVKESKVEMA